MSDAEFRVAREFDVVKVRVSSDGQKRVERLQAECRCLGCEEPLVEGQKVTCGNCATCYNALLRQSPSVRVQKMREGKTLPPTKGGRKPANKFTRELAEAS